MLSTQTTYPKRSTISLVLGAYWSHNVDDTLQSGSLYNNARKKRHHVHYGSKKCGKVIFFLTQAGWIHTLFVTVVEYLLCITVYIPKYEQIRLIPNTYQLTNERQATYPLITSALSPLTCLE